MPGIAEYPTFNTTAPPPVAGVIPTYPTPYGQTGAAGSTGGLVDVAAQAQQGVQNGINMAQQITKAQRDTQAYNEQQAKNKHNADFVDATPGNNNAPPAAGHADFMSSVLNGLHSLGTGVEKIFGFGGGGIPAPAQPAPVQAQMNGGVVTKPEFMQPQPSVMAFQHGGPIPTHGMGVVTGGVRGIPGFADGGAIPDPAAAEQAGQQNGAAQAQQVTQDAQANTQYAQGQDARAARAALVDEIHNFHDSHDKASLDDNGDPKGARGVQAPPATAAGAAPAQQATAAAVQDAATNPEAKTGQVATTPAEQGKPKSITPDQWEAWEQSKYRAAHYAALAGEDPGQVLQSLTAVQNGFIQGHVLRYLAAANVAQQSGDQKGVEQALKNAYYYMPDGKELQIKKDANGNLIYQDPISPTDKDGKPNMIPVDAAHIQMLGQAMLDPMNVQTTINNIRMAHATMQKELMQGQGALLTGQGNLERGQGVHLEGQARVGEVNSTNYKNFAEGDAARIRANAIANHLQNLVGKQANQDPEILKAANAASDQFDKQAAGEYGTVPLTVPDTRPGHQGEMVPNTDPNAGKPMRDPSKIPAELKDLSPSQIMEGRAVAGEIIVANRGKSPAEAVRLAALYAAGKSGRTKGAVGQDGKPTASVHTDPKTGDTWVWNPGMKKWETFKLPMQSAQTASTGGSVGPMDPVAAAEVASNGSGQTGVPAPESSEMTSARTGENYQNAPEA